MKKQIGLLFENHTSYVEISEIKFTKNDSWTIYIVLKEFKNNGIFNFFLGGRKRYTKSFTRKENKVYYRAEDGGYIGGVDYIKGDVLNLLVSYKNGEFIFTTNTQMIKCTHFTNMDINCIGSGYNGEKNEESTFINEVRIWNKRIISNNIEHFKENINQYDENLIGNWNFDTGSGNILYDNSMHENHGTLHNTKWIEETSNQNRKTFSSSNELKKIKNKIYNNLEDLKNIAEIGKFIYKTNYFSYPCIYQENYGDYLFVMFTGANDRTKTSPPYFDRWSWNDIFPGAILNISDPTLDLSEKLRIGWYCGNKYEYPVEIIADIVKTIAKNKKIENKKIIFYGSSGAGFTALATARYIKDCTAVAINAQTNCLKYYKDHVNDMKETCFENLSEDKLIDEYDYRFNMITKSYPKCNISASHNRLIIQNTLDKFHFKNHYLPFVKYHNVSTNGGFSSDKKIQSIVYTSGSGHGPEPKEMIPYILKKIKDFDISNAIIRK